MDIGLGVLQLPPDAFWGMSLKELYSAIDGLSDYNSGGEQSGPMTRDELEELMERYPD